MIQRILFIINITKTIYRPKFIAFLKRFKQTSHPRMGVSVFIAKQIH